MSAGFVILLLAARHARLPADFTGPGDPVVLVVVGAIVAAVAVYEYFFSDAWNRFVIEQVEYIRYQVDILHTHTVQRRSTSAATATRATTASCAPARSSSTPPRPGSSW